MIPIAPGKNYSSKLYLYQDQSNSHSDRRKDIGVICYNASHSKSNILRSSINEVII